MSGVGLGFLAVEDPSRTHHWLWPEGYELLWGGLASALVFSLLYWKAWPVIKKGMQGRTARVQQELDDSASALSSAQDEAQRIGAAKGDIDAERRRLLAEADEHAEAMLTDGRARLDAEVAELETKADADNAALAGRASDELRSEIGGLAAAATDRVVEGSLDDAAQQRLIEEFISRVGASGNDHSARVGASG